MIITPTDDKRELGSVKTTAVPDYDVEIQSPSDEPPPDYAHSQHLPLPPSPPLPRPSNFVTIVKKDGSVKGAWLIDPALAIPTSFLTPLAENEVRKNFSVIANDGSIDVDVTVVQGNDTKNIPGEAKKRMIMFIKAKDGRVKARLHGPPPSSPLPRPSISLTLQACDGSVSLSLPRTFNGPLSITIQDGSTHFSPEITAAVTTFSEVKTRKIYFVGDYSAWRDGDAWLGDEAVLDVRDGSVRIQFDDEVVPERPRGFWAKLFRQ